MQRWIQLGKMIQTHSKNLSKYISKLIMPQLNIDNPTPGAPMARSLERLIKYI